MANHFRFTESERSRTNRDMVKRDGNKLIAFMESPGYILLDANKCISAKELYHIYSIWYEENSFAPPQAPQHEQLSYHQRQKIRN